MGRLSRHFINSQKKLMDTVSSRCPVTVKAEVRAPNPDIDGTRLPGEVNCARA